MRKYRVPAIIVGIFALLFLAVWYFSTPPYSGGNGRLVTPGVSLPENVSEQIIIDPRRHTIVFRRTDKVVVTHLPDKVTTIDILKDGRIKVSSPQWGLEARPFVGLGFSTDAHFAVGLDGAYWKRFDVGGGVRWNFGLTDPRFFLGLTYNMKDNLRIGITIDHKKAPGLMLSLRV